jgi:hypothetical protein
VRIAIAIAVLLLISGCPRAPRDDAGSTAALPPKPVVTKKLAVVFSATESDPWASEIINVLGAHLGIDPWSAPSVENHLDVYGPYEGAMEEQPLTVSICLSGLTAVSDLAGQQALAGEVLQWLAWNEADVVWLDGDPLQLQVGRQLDVEQPIIFSGVVLDKTLFYDSEHRATGVYRRHNLVSVLGEIWAKQTDARNYALLIDDSPESAVRAHQFAVLAMTFPDEYKFYEQPPCHSWTELKATLRSLPAEVDALVFCGVGEEGCSADFLDKPYPADLLTGVDLPAVVLGPSRIDMSGVSSMRINPPAHALEALEMVGKVLGGADPRSIPVTTPDAMGLFVAEQDTPDEQDTQSAG